MKIAIGADHRGFAYKEFIKDEIVALWLDVGAADEQRSDYPVFAQRVCEEMQKNQAEFGILICGSGVGMVVAANRFKGIYAGLACSEDMARVSREDDNINVLVIPSDFVTAEQAVDMINAWLQATFKRGRYQERIDMIDELGGV